MEPTTPTTPPASTPAAPTPPTWWGKLDPSLKSFAGVVLAAAFVLLWAKLFPGVPAPALPTPQVQSAPPTPVIILNMGPPVQAGQPVMAAK